MGGSQSPTSLSSHSSLLELDEDELPVRWSVREEPVPHGRRSGRAQDGCRDPAPAPIGPRAQRRREHLVAEPCDEQSGHRRCDQDVEEEPDRNATRVLNEVLPDWDGPGDGERGDDHLEGCAGCEGRRSSRHRGMSVQPQNHPTHPQVTPTRRRRPRAGGRWCERPGSQPRERSGRRRRHPRVGRWAGAPRFRKSARSCRWPVTPSATAPSLSPRTLCVRTWPAPRSPGSATAEPRPEAAGGGPMAGRLGGHGRLGRRGVAPGAPQHLRVPLPGPPTHAARRERTR